MCTLNYLYYKRLFMHVNDNNDTYDTLIRLVDTKLGKYDNIKTI